MENVKYKEGDRVLIKSLGWYNDNKDEYGDVACGEYDFVSHMTKFCGKILTIDVDFEDETYLMKEDNDGFVFTDEMFEGLAEETTPEPKFKVGDKVILDPYPCIVVDVHWTHSLQEFVYTVRGTDFGKIAKESELVFDESQTPTTDKIVKDISADWDNFKSRYNIPDGYHFVDKNGNEINISEIVLEKKKPKYPTTYAECCKVLGLSEFEYNHTGTKVWYRHRLMATLDKLMLCRDAYWKIAGEEMGLGKPWSPSKDKLVYSFYRHSNEIETAIFSGESVTFEFPTEEMRDDFKELFDPDIEICKELL